MTATELAERRKALGLTQTQLAEPRCTPCALAERDAALAVLRELVAAGNNLSVGPDAIGYSALYDALDAARRLLAGGAKE